MGAAAANCRNGEFRLGEWLVRPPLNQLSRGDTVVHLRPKAMDVLTYLAAHSGEVASKQEILDAVWAKKFLADSALSRAVCELREVLGDEAHGPKYIETIPKRGYRLIAPLVAVEPAAHDDAPFESPPPRPAPSEPSKRRAAFAVFAAILLLLTAWVTGHEMRSSRYATKPSPKRIAVLPFENLGAPEDDYLAAGLTDEIAGRLTRVGELAVISRASAERVASPGRSTRAIGRELSVDYLLTGTVRWERNGQGPSRVRITPRLICVADDTQLWADVYDHGIEDIFRVQSEIARNVITEIGVALARPLGPVIDAKPTSNVEAYQAFLRGLHHMRIPGLPGQDARLALQMFQRAVDLDPSFALAHAGIGWAQSLIYHFELRTVEEHRVQARLALERALELDPDNPAIHIYYALPE